MAAYVGWQSSSILKPLLQQGLSDTEEFVIYKALNALTAMCQLGLLQKPHIYEFVSDIGELRPRASGSRTGCPGDGASWLTFTPPPGEVRRPW